MIVRRFAAALLLAPALLVTACAGSTAPAVDASPSVSASPTEDSPFTYDADGAVTGITYEGREGVTALELLLEVDPSAAVEGEGEMAFVTGIGGRAADSTKNEFWLLEVDGEMAQVGAGSLVTTDGETITWTLDTF